MDLKQGMRLAACVALCEMAGIVGSIFTMPAIASWYANIAKPELVPPNWVFAPVWTLLFLLMGIALYIVWSEGLEKKGAKTALAVFGIQLFLNVLWSYLFFGLGSFGLAFAEIIVLWLSIMATTVLFYRLNKTAGLLLVPYLLWVAFASYLNYGVWMLNP